MADEDERYGHAKTAKNNKIDFVRQEYKRYKRKKPPPDFTEVVDFDNPETFCGRVDKLELCNLLHSKFGLRCAKEWRAFKLKSCPGVIFIANPFLPGAQHYWTRRCIRDFPRKPNVSNLDAHMELGNVESVWEMSRNQSEHQDLMDKLRWVHLGYHFDYNSVSYKPDKYYGFPEDLGNLMQHIALAIGYPGYIPETGIVNYYPLGSSMGGHTDHYELDLSWPLVSLSFGQTAVFLIGGATRDVRPTALYIRSGDILIMSGESRAAFHAVPRIVKVGDGDIPPDCLRWDDSLCCQSGESTCMCGKDNGTDEILKTLEETRGGNKVGSGCQMSAGLTEAGILQCVDHLSLCETSKTLPGTGKGDQTTEESALHQVQGSSDFSAVQKSNHFPECSREIVCSDCELPVQGEQEIDFVAESLSSLTQEEWQPYEYYLSKTRINLNVRQVHKPSETVISFDSKP